MGSFRKPTNQSQTNLPPYETSQQNPIKTNVILYTNTDLSSKCSENPQCSQELCQQPRMNSEKSEKDRNAEDDEPDNVNQEQGLRGRTAIPDLAKPQLGDLDAGALGVGAAAPVGDAVDAADRVGAEAIDGADDRGARQRGAAAGAGVGVGGQFDDGVRSDGGEGAEDEDGEEEQMGFGGFEIHG